MQTSAAHHPSTSTNTIARAGTGSGTPNGSEAGPCGPGCQALAACLAAMLALAVAMGIGRFAFTPMFPLMLREGALRPADGALLAASNYLGYLLGALLVARVRGRIGLLFALGLAGTAVLTAGMGWTSTLGAWLLLRGAVGSMSAIALVATSAWGMSTLAALQRPSLVGVMFAGVGAGIAATGLLCLLLGRTGISGQVLWLTLAGAATLAGAIALLLRARVLAAQQAQTAAPTAAGAAPAAPTPPRPIHDLVLCYGLFGFGYILPATYLPAMARQLVDDPAVFGWAWPLFGSAAALSTILVSRLLHRFGRLRVIAVSYFLMSAGLLLPVLWHTLSAVCAAALLVGGTFMVITMLGMQEARLRAGAHATAALGHMTAAFALGQLLGPALSAGVGWLGLDGSSAINGVMQFAALGLVLSGRYLWRQARSNPFSH